MTELLVRGGDVIDGTGAPRRRADVALRDGRIVAIGEVGTGSGARTIDATGRVVSPGFIDIHSHSDESVLINSALESTVHQGVTCVVAGNCGGASAPVMGLAAEELDRDLARYDLERTWSSFSEYAALVEHSGSAINFCSFVGHGTLRMCVMGADDRAPTGGELAAMKALLAKSLDDGAIGLSTGLIYPPSAYGTTDEISALAAVVREHDGLYASHIRNEGDELFAAIEENLEIGRRSGVRVQLSHHKASQKRNWGKVKESTAMIERAQAEGVNVIADQYPYTASSTGLAVTIPKWAHAGGSVALCERLRDPAVRQRIRGEYTETERNWPDIVIARAMHHPDWSGKSVAELADSAKRDPLEWTCDALIEHDGAIDIIHHSMDEADVRYVMARPWVCAGSDSRANAPYGPLSYGKPHPRSYGTFPRILGHYARDVGVITLEDAVRKMTSATAARLGLRDRGLLREGMFADVVVFDDATIIDLSTPAKPHQLSRGVEQLFVNGVQVIRDGKLTGATPGRALRRD